MIGTLARIDHHASAGNSPWHRASALTKLVLALLLIGIAVSTGSLALLGAVFALTWTLALTSRLPLRLLLLAAGYPIFFSVFFALLFWSGDPLVTLRLLLRPLTASAAAVWLVGTTPYPDLFAPLSRVLPRRVGDGLFLTYRALFELVARAERLWRALRLRGGADSPARRRLVIAGEGLGTLVLYGFERSQRLYATMLLRGHSGPICGCRHYAELTRADWLVALTAGVLVSLVIWLGGRP